MRFLFTIPLSLVNVKQNGSSNKNLTRNRNPALNTFSVCRGKKAEQKEYWYVDGSFTIQKMVVNKEK